MRFSSCWDKILRVLPDLNVIVHIHKCNIYFVYMNILMIIIMTMLWIAKQIIDKGLKLLNRKEINYL